MNKRITFSLLLAMLFPAFSFSQYLTSLDFISSVDYNENAHRLVEFREPISRGSISSRSTFNYRIGANFNARLYDAVYLKTGIRYSEMGLRNMEYVDEFNTFWDPSVVGSSNFVHISYYLRFIEIPIALRYQLGKGPLSFFFEGGLSSNIYINSQQIFTTKDYSETTNYRDGVSRINYAIIFSVGINYSFSQKHQFFFQPIGRAFRKRLDGRSTNKPTSLGLEIGFRYTLSNGGS